MPGDGPLWRSFGFGLRKFRERANGYRETDRPEPWGYGKNRPEKFCLSRITLSKPIPPGNPSPKVCEKMPNLPGGQKTVPAGEMYVSACVGNTSFIIRNPVIGFHKLVVKLLFGGGKALPSGEGGRAKRRSGEVRGNAQLPLPSALRAATFPKGEGIALHRQITIYHHTESTDQHIFSVKKTLNNREKRGILG